MSRTDDLRAQLALAELEESLVAAKADRDCDPDALTALKEQVRVARRAHREGRPGLVEED